MFAGRLRRRPDLKFANLQDNCVTMHGKRCDGGREKEKRMITKRI